MKQENNNANPDISASQTFKIDEKDFRMWVFDRHNPEDSAIFEPVKAPDRNKILEQIPPEYTQIRDFIANSPTDELALELTEKRKQHRKDLEQEYIKEKLAYYGEIHDSENSFDEKSDNLRKALLQTYENTDAKISFSSRDYSQIKKNPNKRQQQTVNSSEKEDTREDELNSQLKKYKTANICLIALIFALLIFFVGQRYIERNSIADPSLFYPLNELQSTEAQSTAFSDEAAADTTDEHDESTTLHQETTTRKTSGESTTSAEKNFPININTATKAQLQTLEGIGEVKAARIIEYRETYGNFSSTRDLLKVSGIGEKTYEKIKDKITVE